MNSRSKVVCQVTDLKAGQMKQFSVDSTDILLSNVDGQFLATGAYCSHDEAPLETGVLYCNKAATRVICPWHNACFSVTTGKMLAPPGRDNLTTFPVQIKDDMVYVELPNELGQYKLPEMATYNAEADPRQFMIVGSGAGGSAAAEMLRQVGFQGKITVLTQETKLPYDRTKLSKANLQSGQCKIRELRSQSFYQQHHINIQTGITVTKLDIQTHQLHDSIGQVYNYDSLLLATGGQARQLDIPGSTLQNVYTLRQANDAAKIFTLARMARRVVIIGAGFIGMEAAASLQQYGLEVTVIAPEQVPFEQLLGQPIGQLFKEIHEAKGVTFYLNHKATKIHGDLFVSAVELDSGKKLLADIVLVGIGIEPTTDWLRSALDLTDSGAVSVNQYLQATDNIYAVGDIASFPEYTSGEPVRIEHWRLALQQGQIAACNMAGQAIPFKAVPFFWTRQYDIDLRYVGHAETWNSIYIDGSLDQKKFLAFYLQDNRIAAVAGIGCDRDIAAISELMRLDQMPTADKLQQQLNWITYLTQMNKA